MARGKGGVDPYSGVHHPKAVGTEQRDIELLAQGDDLLLQVISVLAHLLENRQ